MNNNIISSEFAVLYVLLLGESHAIKIIKTIEDKSNFEITFNDETIRRTLRLLREDNWIELCPSNGNGNSGRPYMVYRLTNSGEQLAKDYIKALTVLLEMKNDC